MKEQKQHVDKLGRPINLDDCVAFPHSNTLRIGKVRKLNNKMIGIDEVTNKKYCWSGNKYPDDCVVVNSAEVTMYLLRN
jgi:hypothetical protein